MRWITRLATVVVVGSVLSGCWPQPGFDAGRTNANPHETVLTRATVGGLAVLWTREVQPGTPVTGIVSVGDGVYVTAFQGRAARLDATTGVPVWSRVVESGSATGDPVYFRDRLRVTWSCCRPGIAGTYWLDPTDGEVTEAPDGAFGAGWANPAIAQGRLAGWSDAPQLFRTLTWGETAVTATGGAGYSAGGSYAIVGDRIHWSYATRAVRFGPHCGGAMSEEPGFSCEPDWETELGGLAAGVAAVGTDTVVWTDWSGGVTALDTATGAVRWRGALGSPPNLSAPPVVAGDSIVVSTADTLVGFPAAGCGAATCSPGWESPVGGITGAAGGGDVVYATTGRGDVVAYAVDGCGAPTCAPLVVVHVGDTGTRTPIVDGGRLLVGDDAGRVTALGLAPASPRAPSRGGY